MHNLYKLKENIVKELEELGGQSLTKSNLEDIDKLAHAGKNVAKIIECCEEEEYSNAMGGYSRRGSYADMSYADDGRGDFVRPDGSYRYATPEASYARGRRGNVRRDAMGRYSRSGDISEDLEKLMNKTDDERVKDEIRRLMDRM
jgi:hypothetical protein